MSFFEWVSSLMHSFQSNMKNPCQENHINIKDQSIKACLNESSAMRNPSESFSLLCHDMPDNSYDYFFDCMVSFSIRGTLMSGADKGDLRVSPWFPFLLGHPHELSSQAWQTCLFPIPWMFLLLLLLVVIILDQWRSRRRESYLLHCTLCWRKEGQLLAFWNIDHLMAYKTDLLPQSLAVVQTQSPEVHVMDRPNTSRLLFVSLKPYLRLRTNRVKRDEYQLLNLRMLSTFTQIPAVVRPETRLLCVSDQWRSWSGVKPSSVWSINLNAYLEVL